MKKIACAFAIVAVAQAGLGVKTDAAANVATAVNNLGLSLDASSVQDLAAKVTPSAVTEKLSTLDNGKASEMVSGVQTQLTDAGKQLQSSVEDATSKFGTFFETPLDRAEMDQAVSEFRSMVQDFTDGKAVDAEQAEQLRSYFEAARDSLASKLPAGVTMPQMPENLSLDSLNMGNMTSLDMGNVTEEAQAAADEFQKRVTEARDALRARVAAATETSTSTSVDAGVVSADASTATATDLSLEGLAAAAAAKLNVNTDFSSNLESFVSNARSTFGDLNLELPAMPEMPNMPTSAEELRSDVKDGAAKLESAATDAPAKLRDAATKGASTLKDAATTGASKLRDAATTGATTLKDSAAVARANQLASQFFPESEALSTGAAKLEDAASAAADKAQSTLEGAATTATDAATAATDKAQATLEAARASLSSMADELKSIAEEMRTRAVSGDMPTAEDVQASMADVVTKVKDAMPTDVNSVELPSVDTLNVDAVRSRLSKLGGN